MSVIAVILEGLDGFQRMEHFYENPPFEIKIPVLQSRPFSAGPPDPLDKTTVTYRIFRRQLPPIGGAQFLFYKEVYTV